MMTRPLLLAVIVILPLAVYLAGCSGGTASIAPRDINTSPMTSLAKPGATSTLNARQPLGIDQRKIALVADKEGHWNLMVMRSEDSTSEVVAKDVLPKLPPAWSRDGWFLYYARVTSDGASRTDVSGKETRRTFELLRWSAETKEESLIGKVEGEQLAALNPSPDGDWIAVMVDKTIQFAAAKPRQGIAPGDKSIFQTLVDDAVPQDRFAWSSTSDQVAYHQVSGELLNGNTPERTGGANGGGLVLVSFKDKHKTRITGNREDRLPVWQNRGSKLLFRRGPELYLATSDGRYVRKFVDNVAGDTVLWSPDDARVAFLQTSGKSSGKGAKETVSLTILDATGKPVSLFSLDAAPDAYQFSWSPASNELVLSCTARDTAHYPVAFFNINTKEHRLAEKFPVALDVKWF